MILLMIPPDCCLHRTEEEIGVNDLKAVEIPLDVAERLEREAAEAAPQTHPPAESAPQTLPPAVPQS